MKHINKRALHDAITIVEVQSNFGYRGKFVYPKGLDPRDMDHRTFVPEKREQWKFKNKQ